MNSSSHDDESRRAYWTQQMDEAHDFMMRVRASNVADCGEPFESLRDVATAANVEVVFSDAPFAKTMERRFYLRRGLIPPFLAAAREMNERGWVMKIEDAYRTPDMQAALQKTPELFDALVKTVLWETHGKPPSVELLDRRLLAMIAFCPIVGTHISGSAIDISVFERDTGREIDRGAPYLTFNCTTPMASPYVDGVARHNRQAISDLMQRHGFIAYPWEFWHYNQQDAYDAIFGGNASRARYGPVVWDFTSNAVDPVENPTARLNSIEQIDRDIHASLQRVGAAQKE